MEINLQNCWDCPVSLRDVLPVLLGCALATGVGAWLAARTRRWLRAAGVLVTLPAGLLLLAIVIRLPQIGIRITEINVWYGWDARIILLLLGVGLPGAVWHATWKVAKRAT